MAATRFTLIDGTRIQLSKGMRNALLAMPDDGFSHSARVVERMRDLGLVEAREGQGFWELTDQGRHVRRQFPGAEAFALSLPLTPAEGAGEDTGARSARLTLSPKLDGFDRRRIAGAHLSPREAPAPVGLPFRRAVSKRLLNVGALVVVLLLLVNPVVVAPLVLGAALAGFLLVRRFQRRSGQEPAHGAGRGPEHVYSELAFYGGYFVSPDSLDERAREQLTRCQTAVDRVLESDLHTQNLLLDAPRNRIVLEDVEWSVATRIQKYTEAEQTVRDLTADGLTEGPAVERARAAFTDGMNQVRRRVRTLEDYARQVMRAELSRRDHPVSQELHEVADDIIATGAAQPHEDAALNALVNAQRLAFQVERLSGADVP